MKTTKPATHTDGLERLRAVRASIQREIGATPQERAAFYQEREKSLQTRIYRPTTPSLRDAEPAGVLREEPPKT